MTGVQTCALPICACWGVVGVVADNYDLALAMAHGQERGERVRALRATRPLASGCGVVPVFVGYSTQFLAKGDFNGS